MISSIEISRFRGIREGKLEDLTPLVVLVGPNGCGKSTVLDALLIGASAKTAEAAQQTFERHHGDRPGWWRWFAWRADVGEPAEITVSAHTGAVRTSRMEFHSTGTLRTIGPVAKQEVVPEIRLVDARVLDGGRPVYQLYSEAVRQGRRNEAKAIITEVVPRAKDLEILTEEDRPILHLVFDDHSVPVVLAGDGVYSLVRLAFELATHPCGSVLLEEPEVHQHPGAIRQTMRAVLAAVRRNIQVILTTHSLELIDALLAESSDEDLERLSLYRLQLEDGGLQSHRMSGPEVAFSRTEIENDLR